MMNGNRVRNEKAIEREKAGVEGGIERWAERAGRSHPPISSNLFQHPLMMLRSLPSSSSTLIT